MKNSQKAFTLIELLVVIGIIGVLMATMVSVFGGASDNAKATKCKANMKQLATAVGVIFSGSSEGGYMAAGSYKYIEFGARRNYYTHKGWISWYDQKPSTTVSAPGQHVPFNTADVERGFFAITNGALWQAMGGNDGAYRCPVHEFEFKKKMKRPPLWSYVMNETFGWDKENGKYRKYWSGVGQGSYEPSRMLLFAEMQGIDVDDKMVHLRATPNTSGSKADCVLQYTDEVIGFNHYNKSAKVRTGHVAFLDGHVEELRYPRSGSLKDLTEGLCKGHEIVFREGNYMDLNK